MRVTAPVFVYSMVIYTEFLCLHFAVVQNLC